MLIDDILAGLDETGGNAPIVAERLSVSPTYVYRIKRNKWGQNRNSSDLTLPAPTPPPKPVHTSDELVRRLAPNLAGVQALRDDTVAALSEMVADRTISPNALTRLLGLLLKYEESVNTVIQPTLNLYDNRQVNVMGDLVNELSNMDPDQLRMMAGVDDIIDISPTETK